MCAYIERLLVRGALCNKVVKRLIFQKFYYSCRVIKLSPESFRNVDVTVLISARVLWFNNIPEFAFHERLIGAPAPTHLILPQTTYAPLTYLLVNLLGSFLKVDSP